MAAVWILLVTLQADPRREAVKAGLQQISEGKLPLSQLAVTYDDLHGLHGGLKLTLRGDGTVKREAVRVDAGEAKEAVDPQDLRDLVTLLLHHQAWEQRVPARAAVPDESTARLEVKVGEASVTLWEWYNDLGKNRRIGEIRDRMKKAGLKSK